MREAQAAIDTEALRTSERALTLIEAHREECRQGREEARQDSNRIITEIRLNREDEGRGRAELHVRIDKIWNLALVGVAGAFVLALTAAGVMAWAILDKVH